MDRYLATAERVLAEAERRSETYTGPCHKCKYHRIILVPGSGGLCVNPLAKLAARNQTDAYASGRIQECSEQRDRNSTWGDVVCGPDGALFEPSDWPINGTDWLVLSPFFMVAGFSLWVLFG